MVSKNAVAFIVENEKLRQWSEHFHWIKMEFSIASNVGMNKNYEKKKHFIFHLLYFNEIFISIHLMDVQCSFCIQSWNSLAFLMYINLHCQYNDWWMGITLKSNFNLIKSQPFFPFLLFNCKTETFSIINWVCFVKMTKLHSLWNQMQNDIWLICTSYGNG